MDEREVKWTDPAKTWLAVLNEIKDRELEIKRAVYKHVEHLAKAQNKKIPALEEINFLDFSFNDIEEQKTLIKKKIMDELELENGWYKAKSVFMER